MLSAICCQSDSIFTIWISPLEINSFTPLKSENTFLVSMLPIPTANTQKGTEQTSPPSIMYICYEKSIFQ